MSVNSAVIKNGAVPDGKVPWGPLLVLVLGTFMGILDASIVNVALPRIMAIFNSSFDEIQWVMTIYLLVGGVVIPITGYLGDRYGYKLIYILALAFFTVSSGFCGFSWNTDSLVVARGFQAIGGGMVIPLSMAIIYKIVPREKIGMALGIWGLTMTVAPAIGPTLGGYLVDNFSWRLIFYINLPVGIIAVYLSYLFVPETERQEGLTFDYPGFILCGIGCFCVLLGLSEGPSEGWGSQYIVTLFTVALFSLALFAVWELIVPQPMLDIRLLRNGIFAVSILATCLISITMFATVFLVPIFAQSVQGYTPMQTGLIIMPMALISGFIMPISGRLFDKVGATPLAAFGLILLIWTTYELGQLDVNSSIRELQSWLVLRGVGLGLTMMPVMTAGMNAVPHMMVGRASAISNVFRQISASFGIAVLTYVMTNRQVFHAARLAETTDPALPGNVIAQQQIASHLGNAGLGGMAHLIAPQVLWGMLQQKAAVLAINDTFVFSILFAVLALPTVVVLTKGRVEAARRSAESGMGHAPPNGKPGGAPAVAEF